MSTLSAPASQDDLAANLPSYCVARDSIDTRASSSFTSRETLITLDYITHRSAGSPSHFSLYEISARSTPNAPFFSTVDLPFYPDVEPSLDTLEDPSDPDAFDLPPSSATSSPELQPCDTLPLIDEETGTSSRDIESNEIFSGTADGHEQLSTTPYANKSLRPTGDTASIHNSHSVDLDSSAQTATQHFEHEDFASDTVSHQCHRHELY